MRVRKKMVAAAEQLIKKVHYFTVTCPSPMKNRDFVLQSSWLQTKSEYIIINHSVHHRHFPAKKGLVRALSYLTGKLFKIYYKVELLPLKLSIRK